MKTTGMWGLLIGCLLAIEAWAGAPDPKSTWMDVKNDGLVKQRYDYSCGPASLATILQEFYGMQVTELDILQIINTGQAATFADLAFASEQLGFKAMGIAANMDHLENLKVPAIVHLRDRGLDHFSVVRGVDDRVVWLADPSWGNRKIRHDKFLKMWKTRDDEKFYGRLLIVLPGQNNATPVEGYYQKPGQFEMPLQMAKDLRYVPPSHGHEALRQRLE